MAIISIILPVYNVAPYLEETFQSLLSQSMSDFEIIAVDDGSTDDSLQILKRYAGQDSRITYFSQSNQGQSVARNLAMQHANGDYVYYMDSDDILEPDALRLCLDYIEKTQADFIFFDAKTFQEPESKPIAWNYQRSLLFEENHSYGGRELLDTMLDYGKYNCIVWGLFIRRVFIDKIQLYFYPGIIHEDELYTTMLFLQSERIYCLQRSLVKHRVRRTSTMGVSYSKRNLNCYLTVADELLKFQRTPIIHKYLRYTLSKVFYTGHLIPLKEKPAVFWRAIRSGYLKYIGLKSALVFWLK